jgi:hypothetical protein
VFAERHRAIVFMIAAGIWGHLNVFIPVYLKLMPGFPSFPPEDAWTELLI